LVLGPALEFAQGDEASSSAVDDAEVAEDVALEVVAAHAESAGCFVAEVEVALKARIVDAPGRTRTSDTRFRKPCRFGCA
jgi:hypothetical protein